MLRGSQMRKLIVLMSHKMTENQKEDAYKTLNVKEILESNQNIKNIWSNIEPKSSLDLSRLDLVIEWIKKNSKSGDYVLVQGEFGATFYIVDYCFKSQLIPIYATSKRQVVEEIQEDKTITNRTFKHEGFREYIRYSK